VVRDYILRTNAADSYYAYCKEHKINADVNYDNVEVHRESFANRRVLPNDIDIFITKENFEKLIKILETRFNLKKKSNGISNYFFKSNDLLNAAITHEKWVLNLFRFPYDYVRTIMFGKNVTNKHCELSIDFVIINDDYLQHHEYTSIGILYPPFGNPDFDVNLLSFTIDNSHQLQITPSPYLEKLHTSPNAMVGPLHSYETKKIIMDSVITNIKNKRAQPIFPIKELYNSVFKSGKTVYISGYRIAKMQCKRYKIDYYNTILPPGVVSFWEKEVGKEEEALCAVCKEQFTNENRAFNVCSKCPYKMHLTCLRDFQKKGSDSCVDCGEILFPENCPCQLINFLGKISLIVEPKAYGTPCTDCKRWYLDCKCWILKCTSSCKAKLELPPVIEPVVDSVIEPVAEPLDELLDEPLVEQ